MDEEWISWEAYREKYKERFKEEESNEKFIRLERWAQALIFRVKNKRSGVGNAVDGVREAVNEIEKEYLKKE